nr:unnamed protein product [Digitaria exilis]
MGVDGPTGRSFPSASTSKAGAAGFLLIFFYRVREKFPLRCNAQVLRLPGERSYLAAAIHPMARTCGREPPASSGLAAVAHVPVWPRAAVSAAARSR